MPCYSDSPVPSRKREGGHFRVERKIKKKAIGKGGRPPEESIHYVQGRPHACRSRPFMKLTRASSYALHAVVYMAGQKDNPIVASHLIARARHIPERFLLKVLKPLVSARLLTSVKGPNGGYRLAKTPAQISVLDIVEAVDGPIRGVVPPIDGQEGGKLDPRLEVLCSDVADRARKQLGKVRIAELAAK